MTIKIRLLWKKKPTKSFPHGALDYQLPRLVRNKYRVAICEELADMAKAKKQVERTKQLHRQFYPEKCRKEPVQLSLW